VRGKTYEDMGTFPQWISKRDIYGIDEIWWSKKGRPWKGLLKEATEIWRNFPRRQQRPRLILLGLNRFVKIS
jgi:hypothetical protein